MNDANEFGIFHRNGLYFARLFFAQNSGSGRIEPEPVANQVRQFPRRHAPGGDRGGISGQANVVAGTTGRI
jgi:hypothetical protein